MRYQYSRYCGSVLLLPELIITGRRQLIALAALDSGDQPLRERKLL